MRTWLGIAVAAAVWTHQGHAKPVDTRCRDAKVQERDLLDSGRFDTAKKRRELQQWAVSECGTLDRYQATRIPPKGANGRR